MIKIEAGQEVMVSDVGRSTANWRGIVVWVGRVWMQVVHEEDRALPGAFRRKFRLDDQTDGSVYSSRARFYTLEQYEEKRKLDDATSFLKGQGIRLDYDSPWRGKETELAFALINATKTTQEKP
jgi:hypothetical protein